MTFSLSFFYRRINYLKPYSWSMLLALMLVTVTLPAEAGLAEVRNVMAQRMRANKQPFNPSSVKETLIRGLYRWEQGGNVGQIYVNEAATLLLFTNGATITHWEQPVRNPEPISEAQKTMLLSQMLKNIKLEKLIHFRQGNGKNQVLLLSAFDCPFSIAFERMLANGNNQVNADIYILPTTLQPRSNAHRSTVRNIWCAADNAGVWRDTLTKGSRGYFKLPSGSCELSNQMTEDVEVILRTMNLLKGYPNMLFGTGEVATPSTDAGRFINQLRLAPGKTFWTEARPDLYAQFRAGGATSNSQQTGNTNLLQGLFQRLGQPNTEGSVDSTNNNLPAGMN